MVDTPKGLIQNLAFNSFADKFDKFGLSNSAALMKQKRVLYENSYLKILQLQTIQLIKLDDSKPSMSKEYGFWI